MKSPSLEGVGVGGCFVWEFLRALDAREEELLPGRIAVPRNDRSSPSFGRDCSLSMRYMFDFDNRLQK